MTRKLLPVILAVFALASCKGKEEGLHPTIEYVSAVLSDHTLPAYRILADTPRPVSSGEVALIGTSEKCNRIADVLLYSDIHENVDGKPVSDGLADFSGETISLICDKVTAPYEETLSHLGEALIREMAVREVIAAVDTLTHLSEYDVEGIGRKSPAKLLVLTDPWLEVYGAFDIDTLLRSAGCGLKVISYAASVCDKALEYGPCVGIISTDTTSIWNCAFSGRADKAGIAGAVSSVFPVREGANDALTSFLDDYAAAGNKRPLDAIVVDDPTADVAAMRVALENIHNIACPESMQYGHLLSRGFRIVDGAEVIARECYAELRGSNIFTHNISRPHAIVYDAILRPGADDGSIVLIERH